MQMTQEYYIIVQPWSLVCSLKVSNKDRPFINGLYSTLLSVLFHSLNIKNEVLRVYWGGLSTLTKKKKETPGCNHKSTKSALTKKKFLHS